MITTILWKLLVTLLLVRGLEIFGFKIPRDIDGGISITLVALITLTILQWLSFLMM